MEKYNTCNVATRISSLDEHIGTKKHLVKQGGSEGVRSPTKRLERLFYRLSISYFQSLRK